MVRKSLPALSALSVASFCLHYSLMLCIILNCSPASSSTTLVSNFLSAFYHLLLPSEFCHNILASVPKKAQIGDVTMCWTGTGTYCKTWWADFGQRPMIPAACRPHTSQHAMHHPLHDGYLSPILEVSTCPCPAPMWWSQHSSVTTEAPLPLSSFIGHHLPTKSQPSSPHFLVFKHTVLDPTEGLVWLPQLLCLEFVVCLFLF